MLVYLHRALPDVHPDELLSVVLDGLQTDPGNTELLQLAADLHARSGSRFAAHEFLRRQLDHRSGDDRAWQLDQRRSAVLSKLEQSSLVLDHPLNAAKYRDSLGLAEGGTAASEMSGFRSPGDPASVRRALADEDHAGLLLEMARLWQVVEQSERTALQKKNVAGTLALSSIAGISINAEQWRRFTLAVYQGRQYGERPDVELMLPVLAKHPLGVEILESWVSSVRGRLLGQAQPLIDALADAHVRNGSAAARFAGLTADIRQRRAGDRELALWLAIGGRDPGLLADGEAAALLAGIMHAEAAYRPSVLLAIAELLSATGDHDGALKCFKSLTRWAAERGLELPAGVANDFSLNAILASAREILDSGAFRRLLRDTLDRVKPREAPLQPAYGEFVLDQFDAADNRRAFYREFGAEVDAALDSLGGNAASEEQVLLLLRVAVTRFRLERKQAALDTLKQALEARAKRRAADGIGRFGVSRGVVADSRERRETAAAILRYRKVLGLDRFSFARFDLQTLQALLQPDADLSGLIFRKAEPAWLRQADSRIRSWLDAGEIDRNIGAGMLLSLARVYRDIGADAELDRLFAYLKAQLAYEDELTLKTMAAVTAAAEELGRDMNVPGLEKRLLRHGAVRPEHMAAAVRRIAGAEGAAAALQAGGPLLEFTLQDRLLDELIVLAEAAGEPEQASRWRVLQNKARISRRELRREDGAAGQF